MVGRAQRLSVPVRTARVFLPAILSALVALCWTSGAAAYPWPLKPFNRPHPIRGGFGDPRYHLGLESQVSAFHFGVDIAAPDGTRVYAVEPGRVTARPSHVVVGRYSGRRFEYWHIRPVVHTGQHVRKHQLLGTIRRGWGHVHLAESFHGQYKDPLRRGALTPFYDHTPPTVEWAKLVGPGGAPVNDAHVVGVVDVEASAYDTPPVTPPAPWQFARLAPAALWCVLRDADTASQYDLVVDFGLGLPPNLLYNLIYAPGSYQNKPFRPGNYLYWLERSLDTTTLPDGHYELDVIAEDTRGNIGSQAIQFQTANGVTGALTLAVRKAARPGPVQPN